MTSVIIRNHVDCMYYISGFRTVIIIMKTSTEHYVGMLLLATNLESTVVYMAHVIVNMTHIIGNCDAL